MQPSATMSLEEAIRLVDEARRQNEVEVTALNRLLHEGSIQITEYTKRQAELREEKGNRLKTTVDEVLAQTYTGPQVSQARYLNAAYDHLLTGRATIDAFAWKSSQRAAQLHSEEACQRELSKERERINQEAQALSKDDLFSSDYASILVTS